MYVSYSILTETAESFVVYAHILHVLLFVSKVLNTTVTYTITLVYLGTALIPCAIKLNPSVLDGCRNMICNKLKKKTMFN